MGSGIGGAGCGYGSGTGCGIGGAGCGYGSGTGSGIGGAGCGVGSGPGCGIGGIGVGSDMGRGFPGVAAGEPSTHGVLLLGYLTMMLSQCQVRPCGIPSFVGR